MALEQRFWSKVDIKDLNECWEWKASCFHNGYGQFGLNYKMVRTNRLAWELVHGPIPEGMCVLHHCDNPKCCNAKNTKDHLFLGTNQDNIDDKVNKNRQAHGENHGSVKLTEEQVLEVRRLRKEGYKQRELADMFGVSQVQIHNIINRKQWRHV
jgi:hypothetical protein